MPPLDELDELDELLEELTQTGTAGVHVNPEQHKKVFPKQFTVPEVQDGS